MTMVVVVVVLVVLAVLVILLLLLILKGVVLDVLQCAIRELHTARWEKGQLSLTAFHRVEFFF